jgi:small subunit ribosomal protein S2
MALPKIIQELLENGVHFGHLSRHWNPKMKKFIFGKKKKIYIIDLQKTVDQLDKAREFARNLAADGGTILFVGTKRQIKDKVRNYAQNCQMPYIVERWIGGFLTNFSTISSRIKKYVAIKDKKEKGEFDKTRSKKEILKIEKEIQKMERNYKGVVSLDKLPDCLFIVDPKREISAVKEARKFNIPIIALLDTDGDPELIDYPIPANDDAIKSVDYLTKAVSEAVAKGVEERKKKQAIISEEKKQESSDEKETQEVKEPADKETDANNSESLKKEPQDNSDSQDEKAKESDK